MASGLTPGGVQIGQADRWVIAVDKNPAEELISTRERIRLGCSRRNRAAQFGFLRQSAVMCKDRDGVLIEG